MKYQTHQAAVFSLRRVVSTQLPTRWGVFQALGFEREIVNGIERIETAVAFVMGNFTEGAPLLRIHSQCFTGEMIGSLRCDCNAQLELAMRAIAEEDCAARAATLRSVFSISTARSPAGHASGAL